MSPAIEQELHSTHREWSSENGLRRDEVRNWQYELYQMKTGLPRLTAAIECHEAALAEHAMNVRLYDAMLSEQEHIVAVSHGKPPCDDLPDLGSRVAREESLHLKQAERHDLLKQHHYEVLKHWRGLMKAISQCEVPPQG
jgi:hypothetical protein